MREDDNIFLITSIKSSISIINIFCELPNKFGQFAENNLKLPIKVGVLPFFIKSCSRIPDEKLVPDHLKILL